MSSDVVKNSQVNVQSPINNPVLQNSAAGFLQGLYPPAGASLGTQTLRNGTSVAAPLNGFQLIPVNGIQSVAGSTGNDNSVWLQGQTGCYNAIVSSNNYFYSNDFADVLASSAGFYQSILPVINETFDSNDDTFKNAYESESRPQILNTSSPLTSDSIRPHQPCYDS